MWKAITRKLAYKILSTDPKDLYRVLENYDVISFDIFDTLIKRNTNKPEDVFELVALLDNKEDNNYFNARITAEQISRDNAINREVTLAEIYKKLEGYSLNECNKLMGLEEEIEKKVCCAYLPMQKIYNWCKENSKTIYLISDMYLSESVIYELLNICGYTPPQKICISCDYKKNKASGEIYDEINKELKNRNWIHIGDSIKGDFIMAKKHGVSSRLIKHDIPCPKYYRNDFNYSGNKLLFKGYLKAFIQNHEKKDLNEFEKVGYEILGPLLTGFCVWLNRQMSEKHYNSVLFFARDSKIILESYNKIFGNNSNNKYFYISRKAAIATALDLLSNYQELHDLLLAKDSATIGDLCSALNIKGNNLESFLKECDVNYDLQVNSNKKFEGERILQCAKKYSSYESEKQRNLLLSYLMQEDAIDNFAIVDLGWEGRTQWILKKILPNSNIDGYYVGIITKCANLASSINVYSYFGKMRSTDYYARVIMESIALFETLFLTNEGSTIGYKFDKNTMSIIPIQTQPDQLGENRVKIERLQMGAMQFINDIRNDKMLLEYKWDAQVILDIYASFSVNPKLETVRLLKTLQFRDNGVSQMGAKHRLPYYLLRPQKLVNDTMKSYYRILFLKDLFKLPLPYFKFMYRYYLYLHHDIK